MVFFRVRRPELEVCVIVKSESRWHRTQERVSMKSDWNPLCLLSCGGFELGGACIWQTKHVDNVSSSFILSILRLTLLLASPERMEAVAVRWHSSPYPLPPADGFSRGVGGAGVRKEYTTRRDASGGGRVEGNLKC